MAESAPGPFAPYVKSITENDSLMRRVPFPKMDIGANDAGMPSGLMKEGPGKIEHVGTGVKSR
jgi:hypothetical protein